MNEKYKGPKFYQESDKDVFFGREEETKKLYYLVENSDFSVCYAESGEGKSSLINAGLSPMLRKNRFLPIRILFSDDVFLNDIDGKTLDNIVWKALENEIQTSNMLANSGFDNIALYPTTICEYDNDVCRKLGWKLRNFELRGDSFDKITPVIIFDQFEEVFTKAKDVRWIDTLFGWLESLFDDSMYAESSNNLHKNFKLLISMRSDYISELDYWSMDRYFIPSLKNNRYYLKSITKNGALEILGKLYPNQLEDLTTDEILRLAQLERTGNLNELEDNIPCISAMVLSLSLACIKEKPKEILKVFRKYQENVQNNYDNWILEFYYNLALKECHLKRAEQDILEMSLIDTNGCRKRISIDDSEISKIGDGVINNLIQKRILYKAGNFIEIAHDSLRGIIDKHNKERLYKTEDKLFFSWEIAVFAFLCIGCYFSIMYMMGAASKHSEDFKGLGIYKEMVDDSKILVMLLFSVPLLLLPHISFLKFENLLNLKNKRSIYPLYMVIIGWFSTMNIDNGILQSVFEISTESIKILCYIYMIVLTIFMGILYIPNLRIFPTKSNRNIIDNSTEKRSRQRKMNFLWFVFFLALALMLQISHKPIEGSIALIFILLFSSYSCIINILIENGKVNNICKYIGGCFIWLLGILVSKCCFLNFAFALIFICPIIMVIFCKISWLKRLKLAAYLISVYLLFFYILTNFTNPLLFLKGYDARAIGSEGYILVEKNNKEAVVSRSGSFVFDFNIADSCVGKTSYGLLRPISIYQLPIRNSQEGLLKGPVMMIPIPIMVNDSISIYRHPDFWGRLYSIQENGTQEQKLASKITFDFIRAYSSSTNDLLDARNVILLYNDLEISLKKQSVLHEANDVIFYQQTLTKYLFVAMIRDAVIENRKSDALKILTLLNFSILGNSHVYDGLKFSVRFNIINVKKTDIQDSLNNGAESNELILTSDNMRSNKVYLVDKFWYDYFIVSTSIARCIFDGYNNKYITDYKSSLDSIAISKSSNLEQGIDNIRKMSDLCNKMLVYIRKGNDSYLTKAVLNSTKQTTILLKNDAASSRHDWRSVLKYRFLRSLYLILPLQKLIVESNNEIKTQDKKINDDFYYEAEKEFVEREKLFNELDDNLNAQVSTYNILKSNYSSLIKK